jgi:hypothetical protein
MGSRHGAVPADQEGSRSRRTFGVGARGASRGSPAGCPSGVGLAYTGCSCMSRRSACSIWSRTRGSDQRAEKVAADLRASGFASRVDGAIMRWKCGKLLSNLAIAVEALLGPDARGGALVRRVREEALTCDSAAGIDYASQEEIARRAEGREELGPGGRASAKRRVLVAGPCPPERRYRDRLSQR